MGLGRGEREVIALAESIRTATALIDERRGRTVAKERGLIVTGTLGLLVLAGGEGWIDLRESIDRLRETNFRADTDLFDSLLPAAPSVPSTDESTNH